MKAGLFLLVTMALLPMSTTEAETRTESDHASVTVFDIFELSPEQFATMLGQSE